MNFYRDPFFCVPRSTHTTRQGKVKLPILYYDSTAVLIFFGCDKQRVHDLLPTGRFRPTLTFGRRAVVGLALFEYRTTSIGAYNEVGLAIPVVWQKEPAPICPVWEIFRSVYTRRVGFHIVDLPVTTEAACAAGRELWGYPKFVTRIDFSLQNRVLDSKVHAPDNHTSIMTISGKAGWGVPSPALDLVNYDRLGDQDLRTIIQTRGGGYLRRPGTLRLRIGDASHPMADHLNRLALDRSRPLCLWIGTRFQSRLNQGAPLISESERE